MEREHKGFGINFDEREDVFIAYKDGERFAKHQSLQQLKLLLDASLKKKFQRLPIYYYDREEITEGEITSFNSLEKEIWLIYGKGKNREKVNLTYGSEKLVLHTPANLKLLQEIIKIASQVAKLEGKKQRITDELTRYDYQTLCKITGETQI